jgi:hypothetical protein
MPTRRLFVLANSYKNRKRCVAGRVVTWDGNQSHWGLWMRPVSRHDHGALSFDEIRLQDGCLPRPLELVDVPIVEREHEPTQPENWFIDMGKPWKRTGEWGRDIAERVVEEPKSLWVEPGIKTDRATDAYIRSLPNLQSLYLIRPKDFTIQIQTKTWNGEQHKQQRAVFLYKRKEYNLSLTDPIALDKYCPNSIHMDDQVIHPNCGDRCLLCVSLTPEFGEQEYHYKVVASVIELT